MKKRKQILKRQTSECECFDLILTKLQNPLNFRIVKTSEKPMNQRKKNEIFVR